MRRVVKYGGGDEMSEVKLEVDDLKAWSDCFDFAELRREAPMQAALVSARIGADEQTDLDLTRHVASVVGWPSQAEALSNGDTGAGARAANLNPSEVVSSVLDTLRAAATAAPSSSSSYPSSSYAVAKRSTAAVIAGSMALADELIPFRAYTISRCQLEFRAEVEAVRSEAARREKSLLEQQKQVVVQAESQRRRHEENAHPNQHHKGRQTTKQTATPPQKQNPFKTAKRQFVDEVDGDLSKIAKKGTDAAGGGHYGAASGVLGGGGGKGKGKDGEKEKERELPPELAHLDKALVEKIENDIVVRGQKVTFSDIAGLEFAKGCVQELICWPMSRPDIFTGLRALPKGLLLFGPPGTGKTLIGKAIAHEAGATFFSISSSSLTSKWIGEGEKMVRTLFAVAAYRQPAVVFIDEVDSLLCARNSDENEATRRLKTEFLVQLDGAGTDQSARVVIVGATNRPEELDEAARRRFVKRIYIPLPDAAGRAQLINRLLGESDDGHALSGTDVNDLVQRTAGFSGADISNLCQEAAMGPVREIAKRFKGDLKLIKSGDMQSIQMSHFADALGRVQPSVTTGDLERYLRWNATFGTYMEASHPLATSQDK